MVPQWIIEKKRDGKVLDDDEIRFFIEGYTAGSIPDYQMATLAMAIYFQGMTFEETVTLTDVMLHSGDLVDSSSISGYKVDKHSTGGIGDKVSLILAPLIACCDLAVPMISGRGLGITGGTLDKLESIPGYRTDLSIKDFLKIVDTCGCCITGQTRHLALADKKLYALRDVTATVPSIPLITASIMCKKLAEGIDGLVLDVKCGKGAFMKTLAQAKELAQNMVEVGTRMDKDMAALITDMNQPLGRNAGNALEVVETVNSLQGNGADDLMGVTMALCARMVILAGKADTEDEAMEILQSKLDSGEAFEKFKEMVKLQDGDPAVLDDVSKLPEATIQESITANQQGFVSEVDAELVGKACLLLGGGRTKTDDEIDFAVGVSDLVKIGEEVIEGDPMLMIHANNQSSLVEATALLSEAVTLSVEPLKKPELIYDRILPDV